MLKLIYFMKEYKKEAILGPTFKLIEAILELFIPIVMAKIIDVGIANNNIPYILKMGAILLILSITGLIFALICQYYASIASQGAGTLIRTKLYNHINKFSYTEIDEIGTPTLITRLVTDINQIQTGIAMLIRLGTRSPFVIIGSTIMAISIDFKLSIILLIATPIIAFTIYIIVSKTLPLFKEIQGKLDNVSLITRDTLKGIRVVKAFSNESAEEERFSSSIDKLTNTYLKAGKISSLLNPITYIIMNLAIVALLHFGGIQINIGNLSQGDIIALVNYITQILLSLIVFSQLVVILTKGAASSNRVLEILNISPSITDNKNNTKTKESLNCPIIEFKDVYFSYKNSKEYSLKDINLIINKNETIGIIGGTGSGKSTLINLIPRFYDVIKGKILIKGIDVRNYKLKSLRSLIGIVPQKAVLFKGSILDNLKFGNINASNDEIINALKISQAYDFVEALPNTYNTEVVQGGNNFSGGQKQRLTIARALVSNPEILILDDSSSALDFITEEKLKLALKENLKDTTLIIVSQRVSSIKNADKIICLDDGEIVGIGTHDYLLSSCKVYKEIYSSQTNI